MNFCSLAKTVRLMKYTEIHRNDSKTSKTSKAQIDNSLQLIYSNAKVFNPHVSSRTLIAHTDHQLIKGIPSSSR